MMMIFFVFVVVGAYCPTTDVASTYVILHFVTSQPGDLTIQLADHL